MKAWLGKNPVWKLLHDPDLRTRTTYMMARRTTTASGRSTPVIRLLCCLVVAAAGLAATGPVGSLWWLAVVVVPLTGSALAIIHAREEVIQGMMGSRIRPLRALGRELMSHGWNRVNLPGVLETFGPLAMAWMVGEPSGPFTGHPAERILAVVSTLLYSGLGTLHWATESIFYQFEPTKTWSVGFSRLVRGIAPILLGVVYGFLFSRNSDEATVTLPWLAACFLLLYPAVVFFEKVLMSALVEIQPAVIAQRLKDATVVHSSISNPLHYALMAVRHGPASDAEALLIYLRGELDRCLDELDHQHPSGTVGEIVEGVRDSLLPQDRPRLVFEEAEVSACLSAVDASLVRSVLADLCCNALKETREGHLPSATVTTPEIRGLLALQVSDDGPGMGEGWEPRRSLSRLQELLVQLDGGLTFHPRHPTGTIATACWRPTRLEEAR